MSAAYEETTLPEILIDPLEQESSGSVLPAAPLPVCTALPSQVKRNLLHSTSALGAGVFLERGCGFLANILAARLGGAPVFGAYSLAIVTANNISTYAAGGIGATATRFSGKYPFGGPAYRTLAASLTIVSCTSAAIAMAALWFGASPIAHLLGKPALTPLLRWAAVPAAGTILLECARGFFAGQRRIAALLVLSLCVGVGMLAVMPALAHRGIVHHMVIAQGSIALTAVLLCFLFGRKLGLRPDAPAERGPRFLTVLREIWSFGFVQLAGLVGSNLAGWWLTTLIARADSTLVQMSFFAVSSQMRNLAGIVPGLLTEGSYATMASADDTDRTPHRVMALCSYASLAVALMLACVGIVIVPWGLHLLYGPAYSAASAAVAMGLAIAVVHMGNAPAAARLTVVSIRSTAMINTAWAVFVGVVATIFLLHGGSAWQGMAIILAAHLLSSAMVLVTLHRRDHVPAGMTLSYVAGALGSTVLATLAVAREYIPQHAVVFTLAMVAVLVATGGTLVQLGRIHGWMPSRAVWLSLRRRLPFFKSAEVKHV